MSNSGFGTGTIVPTHPNYGSDLSCTFDLDPTMTEVSGRLLVAQACLRRLISRRGSLIDDPNYGYDVTAFLGDDLSPSDIAQIASGVDAELLKDERVAGSSTIVTLLAKGILSISTQMTPSVGPTFQLVLAVSQVTVTLLQPTS